MGTELDLDDVAAQHPKAKRELESLRAQLAECTRRRRELDDENYEFAEQAEQAERERDEARAENKKLRAELTRGHMEINAKPQESWCPTQHDSREDE